MLRPLFLLLLLTGLSTARADEPGSGDLRQRLAERLATKQEPVKLSNRGRGGRDAPAKPVPPKPWGYTGEGAPEHWGELAPANKLCAVGTRQSPIDIRDTLRVDLEPIQFDYRASPFSIIDTGYTLEVRMPAGSGLSLGQRRYELQSFHFHRPGEERVNGRAFDMVVHLVHREAQGQIAVLALPIVAGEADHPLIQRVWGYIPLEKHRLEAVAQTLELKELLPQSQGYYTYMGSRTTPPCSEDVLWLVMREPVRLSRQQIDVFARLYPMNARPLQPAGGRIVKESL